MVRMGIWEQGEGLAELILAAMERVDIALPQVVRGTHPAAFSEGAFDILLVSPEAVGWSGAGNIHCRTLLLSDAASPLVRVLRCEHAVSYGASPKDTMTLSSLETGKIVIAIQRDLVTAAGETVERQELVLPFPENSSPSLFLATIGALLLLGAAPNALLG